MSRMEFASVVTFVATGDDSRANGMTATADRARQLNDYGRLGFELTGTVTIVRAEDVQIVDTLQRQVDLPGRD